MAEAAALKLLAPLATDLLKKGYSYLGLDVDVDEKLHDLQNIIVPQIEMVIEAVENSPHKNRLRGWLKSLEEAVYEAEDVLDLHDYYLLEQKVKSSAGGIKVRLQSLPPIKYSSKKFSVKLKRSLAKLEKTAVKAKEFLPFLSAGSSNVTRSQTTNERRVVTTSFLAHKVFGRDQLRNDIVDLLHETAGLVESESSSVEKRFSVVAIVGLGGAGKTTLAQYVCDYEKEAEAKYFDVIMWVHVSQIFDVEKLTREMVESASEEECPNLTNLDTLQRKLKDSIRSKKFLLILDDVWNEKEVAEMQWEQWEKLLVPLKAGKKGSKILMTTREKGVAEALQAEILELKELEKDGLLSLFEYYAFGDAKIDDDKLYELKEIVRQNVPKLHGSPLAAKMVGIQLRNRPDVDFLKSILSGDLLKDTMKSLLWSYQNLDAPLQRCFSYCSLFPKGYKIKREYLIHLWIAEGFIKTTDQSKKIEDVGQKYFDDLLFGSFFQPTKDKGFYNIHDLLHDLAEMDSKDQCFRVEGNLTVEIPQEIRHLSLYINKNSLNDLKKICNLKNLRTLMICNTNRNDLPHIDGLLHNIFVKLRKLRVVDLNSWSLENLPESIEGLKHLRHLNLCVFLKLQIIPKSFYTLYHLEFLLIAKATLAAKRLANLINLQHFDVPDHMSLDVAGINCLKQLENRTNVHGYSVHIFGLENVKEKGEPPVGIMGTKDLHLEWSTTDNISRSSDMDAQILNGLLPPPDLQRLKIMGFQGCQLPSWMVEENQCPLHNLISLEFIKCRQLKQLPILSPTLTKLVLSACCTLPIVSKEDLEIIRSTQDVRISQVVTFMGGFVSSYGSCILLKIVRDLRRGYDSQKLRNWLKKTMDILYKIPKEEEVKLVPPSSLSELEIISCPLTDSTLKEGLRGLTSLYCLNIYNIVSLTSLPSADVLGCLTMLRELKIKKCWLLTSLGGLQALGSLETLVISFCPNLSAEGGSTAVLLPSSLKELKIEKCYWKHLDDPRPDLTSSIDLESSDNIPFAASLQLGHLKLLTKLSITNCPNIGSLLGLQKLSELENLTFMGCPKLTHAETKFGRHIKRFKIDTPSLLSIAFTEEAIASFPKLHIEMFKKKLFSLEEEQVFQRLTSLTFLSFRHCSIKYLPNNLESLSSLRELIINDCPNIMSLPDLPPLLVDLPQLLCNSVLKRRCLFCNSVLKRRCSHGHDWHIAHILSMMHFFMSDDDDEPTVDEELDLPESEGCFSWFVEIWGCMEWLSSMFH